MASLASLLEWFPTERVRDLLGGEGALTVPEPARGFLLAAIAHRLSSPVLVVVARGEEADHLVRDVRAFLGREGAEVFPGWEVLPGEPVSPSVETMGARLDVLYRLRLGGPFVVVTTAQGATQLVAPSRDPEVIELAAGGDRPLDEIAGRLVRMGYERNYIVERRGEFAIRGGILDVFPPGSERPVRAELWGDEISSVREFALASQRSLGEIPSVRVVPCRELRADEPTRRRAAELAATSDDEDLAALAEGIVEPGAERLLPLLAGELVPLPSLFPEGAPALVLDPKRVEERAREVLEQVEEWSRGAGIEQRHYLDLNAVLKQAGEVVFVSSFSEPGSRALTVDTWTQHAGKPEQLTKELGALVRDGYRAVVAASLPETAQALKRNLAPSGVSFVVSDEAPAAAAGPGGTIVVAEIGRGFVSPDARLALVAESDLTGRRAGAARRRVAGRRRETAGPLDLQDGDLVVHEVHGIGRYGGLLDRELLGMHREYIVIEYAKGDILYVPSDQTDLVSKYVGGEGARVNRLNSPEWGRAKARVRRRAREIAHNLVQLYAKRLNAKGLSFPSDTPWMRELEDSFPYEETPDQLRAVDEVKDDLERPIPMDRLVCGDVGYGKTEIAVRAAFQVVNSNKQVAVLVPTTILAQQHHATFVERLRHFPVRVAMLSRFLTSGEQKKTLSDLAAGKIDIVVGTHRLLGADVRFADLGLVVVDEEQRFGVEQKEKLKQLRINVDVMTLSATPIPRTLEMSMAGIRDLSLVDTPPENRHPVMTFVGERDDETVVSAIRRELLRDGQVFYVHPRVETIDHVARRVASLVPEARVGIAHGQMEERLLESSMLDFGEMKTNVLVCTTIIESGLDIPTVNTLIVERADLLGLSQMYQLRGRVGRAHERAYAYLFFPQDRSPTEGAYERLKTIAEHTGLGSGFRIAMRDLEIRGAGNLLGEEQHGHIAEVGFDLYTKLVSRAVDEAKGTPWADEPEVRIDLPLEAYIPKEYIVDENVRLAAYRRIAGARTPEDLQEVRAELADRFGAALPGPVESLFELAGLRRRMVTAGITEAVTVAGNLRIRPLELADSRLVRLKRILPGADWRPATAALVVPERLMPTEGVVSWVSGLVEQLTSKG